MFFREGDQRDGKEQHAVPMIEFHLVEVAGERSGESRERIPPLPVTESSLVLDGDTDHSLDG